MTVLRHLAAGAAALMLGSGLVTVAAVAPASADDTHVTHKRCNPDKFKTHYKAAVRRKAPQVTHITSISLPPTSAHGETVRKTATFAVQLKSRMHYQGGGEVGGSIAKFVTAKASTEIGFALAAKGKVTGRSDVTVTDHYVNRTRHNQSYVVFEGDQKGKGTWTRIHCLQTYDGQGHVHYRVAFERGSWKSFGVDSRGIVACGRGTKHVGPVGRLALKQGC